MAGHVIYVTQAEAHSETGSLLGPIGTNQPFRRPANPGVTTLSDHWPRQDCHLPAQPGTQWRPLFKKMAVAHGCKSPAEFLAQREATMP